MSADLISTVTDAVLDEVATKLLYLILNRSEKEWKPREWSMAKAQFTVIFGKRFIKAWAA